MSEINFERMDKDSVIEVLTQLKKQLFTVNPAKFHNCVAYAIWSIKKEKDKAEKLENEIKDLKDHLDRKRGMESTKEFKKAEWERI